MAVHYRWRHTPYLSALNFCNSPVWWTWFLVYFKLEFYRQQIEKSRSNLKKNPVHQTRYFKLQNCKNQVQIDRGTVPLLCEFILYTKSFIWQVVHIFSVRYFVLSMKKSLFFQLHSVVNQISLAWPHLWTQCSGKQNIDCCHLFFWSDYCSLACDKNRAQF